MKLFILGNGFDLAHKICSTYKDFGDFLERHYPHFYIQLMAAINNDQGLWSDFEGRLPDCGIAMESNGLDAVSERLDELDYNPMTDEGMSYWMREQLSFLQALPNVLRSWVESIDINKTPAYKKGIFSNDDLYLTFNYTDTLENLYHIDNERILHIHGDVNKRNDTLIMGHGDAAQISLTERQMEQCQAEFADGAASVYECVLEFLQCTYKDTNSIIEENEDFFEKLGDVDEVIVIGSSLSNVDKPYFGKIASRGDYHWVFVYFDDVGPEKAERNRASAISFAEKLCLNNFDIVPSTKLTTYRSRKQ